MPPSGASAPQNVGASPFVAGLGGPCDLRGKIGTIGVGVNQVYSNNFYLLFIDAVNAQHATIIRDSLVRITTVK